MSGSGWRVHRAVGRAAAFHQRPLEGAIERTVHVWEVDAPALVLGSSQRDEVVDRAACEVAGVEVVRRRSGGGAVLLDPGQVVWIDLELPRGDPLWNDDVGRAAWWVGERCATALAAVGLPDPVVHRGGMVTTEWSSTACFAGLGPGEVTSGAGGPKALGVSQRRTRAGARFQCAVPLAWDGDRLAGLLALDAARRRALASSLRGAVATVGVTPAAVVDALLDRLALPA